MSWGGGIYALGAWGESNESPELVAAVATATPGAVGVAIVQHQLVIAAPSTSTPEAVAAAITQHYLLVAAPAESTPEAPSIAVVLGPQDWTSDLYMVRLSELDWVAVRIDDDAHAVELEREQLLRLVNDPQLFRATEGHHMIRLTNEQQITTIIEDRRRALAAG